MYILSEPIKTLRLTDRAGVACKTESDYTDPNLRRIILFLSYILRQVR